MPNIKKCVRDIKMKIYWKLIFFYNKEIKIQEKKKRNTKIFTKIPKNLSNKQLSETLQFYPKQLKKSKKLTKYQILKNILPLFEDAGISRRERAFKSYAETYTLKLQIIKV